MAQKQNSNLSLGELFRKVSVAIFVFINWIYKILTEKNYYSSHHLEIMRTGVFSLSIRW